MRLIYSDERYNWIPFSRLGIDSADNLTINNNILWLTSVQGTYKMEVSGYKITSVQKITNSYDDAFLKDREGSIWIGTGNEGVKQLISSPFKLYGQPEGLSSNAILATLEDSRGWQWIGTNCEGLNRITPDGSIKLYDVPQGLITTCVPG